ncbi:unnamed protein product [Sphenostylis stenocarpa]|uniref:Polygalacturonase n=1 Tax=Sphenostylis stenocarpa TaxID=92480 RepID=A0AA86SA59_9FABA|nr:unnamed protein product [Sphenostylis stenocarpa]
MQRVISCMLILGFVSGTLCLSSNAQMKYSNVMDYGAHGDGTTDDSNAILNAWNGVCGGEGPATLLIPSTKTFLVKRLKLNGPCKAPNVAIKGGSGYARKITFEEIILQDVKNSIIIDQYYDIKTQSEGESAVKVSEVSYRGFNGTSASDKAINVNCSPSGCSDISMDQIYIVSSQPSRKAYAFCQNAKGTIGNTVPKVSCV